MPDTHRFCLACKNHFLATLIQCPICLERKSNAVYHEQQRKYMGAILADALELTLVYIPAPIGSGLEPIWHLRRFEDETHGYCDASLRKEGKGTYRQDHLYFSEMHQVTRFCPACRAALRMLVATTEVNDVIPPRPEQERLAV